MTVVDNEFRSGLPQADVLRQFEIWDSYFTPSYSHPGRNGSRRLIADVQRSLPAIRKGEFQRLCYFPHVGVGTTTDTTFESFVQQNPRSVMKAIDQWPDLLIGMIQVNARNVQASLGAIDRWVRDGPMMGVYLPGGGPAALCCTHPNTDRIVERVAALGGVIIQHTWFKTGGKHNDGESTPTDLAELAKRFPDQSFICAHAGGEWERGIRAVQNVPNIYVETSGFDATAGFIDMAVRELGSDRIVFGSHLPSRSLGTELSKILAADISNEDRRKIFGQNFRTLLTPRLAR